MAASSDSMPPFIPKQAISKDPALYASFTAGATQEVADRVLALLPRESIAGSLHDNGCGAGEVTSAILSLDQPPTNISIHATDIDQPYLDKFQTQVDKEKWPVVIANMPSEKLAFEDAKFDLSIANFVIFLTPPDGVTALREAYRTLKPGGTFVHTAWAELPIVEPTQIAHRATRPESSAPLRQIPPQWTSAQHLVDVTVQAGFAREKVRLKHVSQHMKIRDLDVFAEMMWSYLGPPVTGWLEQDEGRWEEAVEVLKKEMEKAEGFNKLEDGGWEMVSVANVVIATK